MRAALLTTAIFLLISLALLSVLPLWLDEILQLIETRQPTTAAMLVRVPHHSGAAPLGYLVQQSTFRLLGYSVRTARLPSALFASAAVFTVALLAADLGIQPSWLAAVIFAVFPLTLRYATESRVYSQALFLSVLATLIYVHLARRPTSILAFAYFLTLTAAAYTQPYAACVGAAHLLWSIAYRERKTALIGGTAFALAIVAFLPWYAWSKASWAIVKQGRNFSASIKTPLMLFREIAGAGYWGSGLLVILCALARPAARTRTLLVLLIIVPLVTVFAADAWFDYFIAARQFIWILPAAAILAAAAVGRRTVWLAALFGIVCIWQNIHYFTAPRENWHAAAGAIFEQVQRGACLVTASPGDTGYYAFFQPELLSSSCQAPRMVLAITPYTTTAERQTAIAALIADGYQQDGEILAGKSALLLFRR